MKGCFFSGKSQRFLKIRVLFWPEISALGVLFNFDNEHMHPPKYLSAPAGETSARKLCYSLHTIRTSLIGNPGGGGTWVFRGVHTFVIKIKKYP